MSVAQIGPSGVAILGGAGPASVRATISGRRLGSRLPWSEDELSLSAHDRDVLERKIGTTCAGRGARRPRRRRSSRMRRGWRSRHATPDAHLRQPGNS
jgi:hypothetical protein